MTSVKRAVLVRVAMAVDLGNDQPSFLVPTRARNQVGFVRGSPTGSVAVGSRSGFLKHFKHHSRVTPDNEEFLIFDNHPSHVTIEALYFCKAFDFAFVL